MDPTTPAAEKQSPKPPRPIPRSGMTRSSGIILALLTTLALAVCGLGLGAPPDPQTTLGTIVGYVALGIALLLGIRLWTVCRAARGIVPLLAVAAFLVFGSTQSLLHTALVVALVFSVAEGSVLVVLLPREKLTLLPLVPIIAYIIVTLVGRDPIGAAAVLVPVPAAVALAVGTRHSAAKADGLTRTGVICATAFALGLSLVATAALILYRLLGTLEPKALLDALNDFREALILQFTQTELPEGATEAMQYLTTYKGASNVVNGTINLLPGLAVVLCLIIATVAQLLQHAALIAYGHKESLTDRVRGFAISLVACILFTATYFVIMLGSSDASTLVGTVAENIHLILLPGLALAGLIRIVSGVTRKGVRGMGCMFYLVMLAPCLMVVAPDLLAIVEVIGHIYTAIISRIKPPAEG